MSIRQIGKLISLGAALVYAGVFALFGASLEVASDYAEQQKGTNHDHPTIA